MDEVASRIEHTILGPATAWSDVTEVIDAAEEFGMRACVPPWAVERAGRRRTVPLTTVVDFPHGQGAVEPTVLAAETAADDGATELDLVANVGALKDGDARAVCERIEHVQNAVECPLKVIVEAPLLTDEQTRRIGQIAADAGADFLKTATGFADGGATVSDVELLGEYLPVKASGGIGSWDAARAMFDAGAARIGASRGDVIVREWAAATGDG
jgi:deoxyribose-phosphate aldolase